MSRGKYAAKANGQRANVAENTAATLRTDLAELRREHMTEIAGLKEEISHLQGQLISEVRLLAAAEIERVTREMRGAMEAERVDQKDRACKLIRYLTDIGARVPDAAAWGRIAELLGLTPGEFNIESYAAGQPDRLNRTQRRMNKAGLNERLEFRRQMIDGGSAGFVLGEN